MAVVTNRRRLPPDERQRTSAIADLSQGLAEPSSTLLEDQGVRRVSDLVGDAGALRRRLDEGHICLRRRTTTTPRSASTCARRPRSPPTATPSGSSRTCGGPRRRCGSEELAQWLRLMQPRLPALRRAVRNGSACSSSPCACAVGSSPCSASRGTGHPSRMTTTSAPRRSAPSSRSRDPPRRPARSAHGYLPNRRLLLEHLHALASREDQDVALLIIDLDNFKH